MVVVLLVLVSVGCDIGNYGDNSGGDRIMVLKAEMAALVIKFCGDSSVGGGDGEDHFDGGGDFDECGGGDRDIY